MVDLVFDFDGTLCEGAGAISADLIEMARHHGFRGSAAAARAALKGCTTDFEVAAALAPSDVQRRRLARRLVEENRRNLEQAFTHPSLPAVLRLLSIDHALHIISNRDHSSLATGLAALELEVYFEGCVGVYDGVPGKPSLRLCELLDSELQRSLRKPIYIGDKDSDYEFAKAAGMSFIRATWFRKVSPGQGQVTCELPEDLLARVSSAAIF